jgi:hypothetical protein
MLLHGKMSHFGEIRVFSIALVGQRERQRLSVLILRSTPTVIEATWLQNVIVTLLFACACPSSKQGDRKLSIFLIILAIVTPKKNRQRSKTLLRWLLHVHSIIRLAFRPALYCVGTSAAVHVCVKTIKQSQQTPASKYCGHRWQSAAACFHLGCSS